VHDQATLRFDPADDARLLRTLRIGETLFLVDDSDSAWLGVRVATSGEEGWIRHEDVTLVSRTAKTVCIVDLPAGQPVTVILHQSPSSNSGGTRLNSGSAFIVVDRAKNWLRVAAIRRSGVRHGWINKRRVHQYLRNVNVPRRTSLRQISREAGSTSLWLALCSGLAGALLTALVALYVAATSQSGLRTIAAEAVEKFAVVMAAHLNSLGPGASVRPVANQGSNVVTFPPINNDTARRVG
jgi:hypothetical protein